MSIFICNRSDLYQWSIRLAYLFKEGFVEKIGKLVF